jgi:hypothetical protein
MSTFSVALGNWLVREVVEDDVDASHFLVALGVGDGEGIPGVLELDTDVLHEVPGVGVGNDVAECHDSGAHVVQLGF